MDQSAEVQSPPYAPRLTDACSECRDRKVKCTGGLPCKHCQRLKRHCHYPPSQRGKRRKSRHSQEQRRDSNTNRSARSTILPRLPAAVHNLSNGFRAHDHNVSSTFVNFSGAVDWYVDAGLAANHQLSVSANPEEPRESNVTTSEDLYSLDAAPLIPDNSAHWPPAQRGEDASVRQSPVQVFGRSQSVPAHIATNASEDTINQADADRCLVPLHKINWEYHGPWSWVSICSPPGVAWVCERTNSNEFDDIAGYFMKSWSKHLKVQRFVPLTSRYPEPAPEMAWKYVDAYFKESINSIYGVVHRSRFEARLQQHFRQNHVDRMEDPAWFALRNTVYATGCRYFLAKSTSISFQHAEVMSWQLFCNALSVIGEMILSHSGMTAIQALTIMACHAMGLAGPCVEYPMIKNAIQLAQAKGLQRKPSASWGLSSADLLTRNWLWWTIYAIDKQMSIRSGRPSSILDDDISTPIPTTAPTGSSTDVEVVTLIIRHAQISSQVMDRIMSVKASRQGFDRAYEMVRDIQGQLEGLLRDTPSSLDSSATTSAALSEHRRLIRTYLHSDIYATMMATHVIFFYPWISSSLRSENNELFREQTEISAKLVAYSARQIILGLADHRLDLTSLMWASFHHPMYAYINLFLYVLKEPDAASARGDMALLNVAVGHFGKLEHATEGRLSFDFPRDCNTLCLRTMRTSRGSRREACTVPVTPQSLREDAPSAKNGTTNDSTDADAVTTVSSSENIIEDEFQDNIDFDDQLWTIFGSIDIPNEFTTNLGD